MPPDPPLPLLVTGVAGVAGYNAYRYFAARYPGQVVGIRRANNWKLSGPGIHGVDMHQPQDLLRLFDRYQFAAVLNCEGTCKLKSCELDPELAWRVNVQSVENLLRAAAPATRLVHLSIDLVFSGTGEGGHREEDPPDPVTVYGKTMAEAEARVLADRSDACVLRISLPMGISFNGHAGAIDWIQSRFRKGKPATLYFDEIRTPKYTDCLNRLCQLVLAGSLAGLYHAGGPRRLSLYQIAQIVNRLGGYDPRHLMGCPRHAAGPIPPRAGNVSLDSSRLVAALGFEPFDPWPLDPSHVPTHDGWHWERSSHDLGSPAFLAEVLYHNQRRRAAN